MINKELEISILKALAQAWNITDNGPVEEENEVEFPDTGYLALFTTMPSRNPNGELDLTNAVEVSGGGYQRLDLDGTPFGSHYFTSAPTWDVAHSCFVIQNSSAIQFPMATASWGDVVGFGIFTKPNATISGDTLTMAGTLDQSQGVLANQAVAFAAGALKISLADVQPAASNSSGT